MNLVILIGTLFNMSVRFKLCIRFVSTELFTTFNFLVIYFLLCKMTFLYYFLRNCTWKIRLIKFSVSHKLNYSIFNDLLINFHKFEYSRFLYIFN